MIDLLPTIVAAAGGAIDPSWHVEGVNLLPLWCGQGREPERYLFWEWQAKEATSSPRCSGDDKLDRDSRWQAGALQRRVRPVRAVRYLALRPERVKELLEQLRAWRESEDPRGKE